MTDRTAPVVVRPVRGVDSLERPNEPGKVERGLDGIVEPVGRGQLARQPLHNTPRVGERLFGFANGDWEGNGKRKVRSEDGQPGLLFGHEVHRPADAREAHGKLVT